MIKKKLQYIVQNIQKYTIAYTVILTKLQILENNTRI